MPMIKMKAEKMKWMPLSKIKLIKIVSWHSSRIFYSFIRFSLKNPFYVIINNSTTSYFQIEYL